MIKRDTPIAAQPAAGMEWGSDVAAEMLRRTGIKYVALNPGASYRGLHDSLVNYLGNENPGMLLCLHEDHVVSIAHGYAKVTDAPMGALLHSNVGLMHGLMGIFNAWCDRMPMLVVGATGPVDAAQRRPWIDWIHTSKDQGALLRDFTKWDDEPRSAASLVESFLRGVQLTRAEPRGPVYICLDAKLQESRLEQPLPLPDPARYAGAPAPHASAQQIERLADLLLQARQPLLMFGRGSRAQADWDRRVQLAELLGASVMTSIRERAIFPTEHPLLAVPPVYWLNDAAKQLVRGADAILSLDWVDPKGLLQQAWQDLGAITAKLAHVSLDSQLHGGWSMDYFGLPPVDEPIMASPDAVVEQLLAVVRARLEASKAPPRWDGRSRNTAAPPAYNAHSASQGVIAPRDLEVALQRCRGTRQITLAHATYGWGGDVYHFQGPLDFMGSDGGAGLAAGPGLTVGIALALKDSGRTVVSVMGDGDFLQGATALWTAARYEIPALIMVSNNRSNFNDEMHQEAVARTRKRPLENRWIGQRIDDPGVDLAAMARAQGIAGEGPVTSIAALENAILKGFEEVDQGRSYFIDVHVATGYANPPLTRGN